ncbi:MAG: hypothetical protein ACJ8AW_26260 [Rhodopila sp.]
MGWFGHSGDMGDIIYALPTIRAFGGGILYLYHQAGKTAHGMDVTKANSLASLLLLQPYIENVIFCPSGHPPNAPDHDLNGFRDHWKPGRNLADMHLATHGLGPEHRNEQWLTVDFSTPAQPVIFARSLRYQNNNFPWSRIWQRFKTRAGFIGTCAEHRAFCEVVGWVPLIHTPDLRAVARTIAECHLFVGNQSCPAAVAEGLKRPMILEVYPEQANCGFERPGRIDGWDNTIDESIYL